MLLPDLSHLLVVISLGAAPAVQAMRPLHELRVLVVDAEGRPRAGVPVAWDQPGNWLGAEGHVATTGTDGLATLSAQNPYEFRLYRHDVGFAFPDLEEVRVTVAADAMVATPLKFVLPPTRRVEVEFVDGDGRRVEGLGSVGLNLVTGDEGEISRSTAPARATIADGRAEFPWVGRVGRLGIYGSVGSRRISAREGEERREGRLEILGADESTTRVRVTTGPSGPILVGRLRLANGKAASQLEVDVYESCFGGPVSCRSGPAPPIAQIRTDLDGRFRASMSGWRERAWLVLAIPDDFGGIAAAAPIHVARQSSEVVEFDVGEARLVEATLLAAGRAIDEQGRPFGAAALSARFDPADRRHDERADLDEIEHDRSFALGERPQARATRGDGAFEFRSFGVVAKGTVSFYPSGPIAEARYDPRFSLPTVALGTRDVVLQLHRTGSIETQVVLPAGATAKSVACLRAAPGQPAYHSGRVDPILFADDVRLDGLVPGPVDLVFLAAAALPTGAEILWISKLEVKAGERCDDPRLASVDLTKVLVVRDLAIVGPDGRPVMTGSVYGAPLDPRHLYPAAIPIENGRCRLPLVRGLEERVVVEVVAPGFAAKVVRFDDLDHEIELAPATVLGITVSPWPLACPVDAVLTQSIRDDETPAHVQPFLSVAMPFWTGETVEIAVPRPGSWQLKLVAHPGVPDREGSLDVDVTSPYVTLKPDECAATFGVRLTSAQVAAIDAFARR